MSEQALKGVEAAMKQNAKKAADGIPRDAKGVALPLESWSYEQCMERLLSGGVGTLEEIALHDRCKVIRAHQVVEAANKVHASIVEDLQGNDWNTMFSPLAANVTAINVKQHVGEVTEGKLKGKKVYLTFTAR